MKLRNLTFSTLALVLMAGCGEDDGTGVEADDIAGTWTATSALFTQTAPPNATADPVVDDGAVVTFVLSEDGGYVFTFVLLPENETELGTYTVSGTTLTIIPVAGTAETFEVARDGDTMTLTDDDTFDFTGTEEPASLVITLTRP